MASHARRKLGLRRILNQSIRYRDAVNYLREHRAELIAAFQRPWRHPHGCLFWSLSPDTRCHHFPELGLTVGCPIQISGRKGYVAWSRIITRWVWELDLPQWVEDLKDSHLRLLADVQLETDLTIRNRNWRREHLEDLITSCGHGWFPVSGGF